MRSTALTKPIQVLFLIFLIATGLYFAKPFLVPLVLAGMFAMLFLPLCAWLQKKGWHRGLASLVAVLCLLAVVAGIVTLISWQVSGLTHDFGKMQEFIQQNISKVKSMASQKLGIDAEQQKSMMKSSGSGNGAAVFMGVFNSLSGLIVDFVLMLVYMFLLLFQRAQIRKFILMLSKTAERPHVNAVIDKCANVARLYLTGLAKMIFLLWVMYGIGFSIVGVKNALFFAILCGLLEVVPFVGNLTGTLLTMTMAISQGEGSGIVIAVFITYGLVQFLQTYILEPLVVGAQVKINPLFTIIVLVIGELIWGIPGMVLAIPLAGIAKIISDNSTILQPFGYLAGETKTKKNTHKQVLPTAHT